MACVHSPLSHCVACATKWLLERVHSYSVWTQTMERDRMFNVYVVTVLTESARPPETTNKKPAKRHKTLTNSYSSCNHHFCLFVYKQEKHIKFTLFQCSNMMKTRRTIWKIFEHSVSADKMSHFYRISAIAFEPNTDRIFPSSSLVQIIMCAQLVI